MTPPVRPERPLFRRLDEETRQERDRPFLQALVIALNRDFPLGEPVTTGYRGPGRFAPPQLAPLHIALDEIVSAITGQTLPSLPAPEGAIDITDPSVDVEEGDLNPIDRFVRTVRMLGRATGHGLQGNYVGPLAPGSGLQRAYVEGLLRPPKNTKEQAIHILGAMLAGAVPFVGGGLGAPSVAGAARGGFVMPGALGAAVPKAAPGLARGLAGDVAIGAVAGGAEAVAERDLLTALGRGEEAPDVGRTALEFGAWGLGLGALFRIPTAANVSRMFGKGPSIGAAIPNDIAPGVQLRNMRSEVSGGKLQFRDVETGQFISASKLSAEDLQEFRRLSITKARDLIEQTPQGDATVAAINSEDFPPALTTPVNISRINLLGGMYLDRAKGLVHRLGKEKMTKELEELRKILYSDEPENVKLAAGGRIRALEYAIGEENRPPGQLPVEAEAHAINTVARVRHLGRDAIERVANDAVLDGRQAYANRVRELMDSDLPQTYNNEILKKLAQANRKSRQGFTTRSKGIWQGRPVELLEKPRYGLAQARYLDDPSPNPVLVDVEQLTPIPVAGQAVSIRPSEAAGPGGGVAIVKVVDPAKQQFLAEALWQGAEHQRWIPFSEIEEIASSPGAFRSQMARVQSILAELRSGDVQPIPPTPAVTPQGEAVTVTAVGSKAAEVVTKDGRTKTIPRESIQPTQAATPEDVPAFAPGTFPEEGNRTIFVRVRGDQAISFERAMKEGKQEALRYMPGVRQTGPSSRVVQAHVLPQAPRKGTVLYAVEIPAAQLSIDRYGVDAKNALSALGGNRTISDYISTIDVPPEVFISGQITSISDDLLRASVRPREILAAMSQEEQTAYLRHLLALNENVPSEVTAPIVAARAAREDIAAATVANDAQGVLEAESRLVEKHVEVFDAVDNVQREQAEPEVAAIVEELHQVPEAQQAEVLAKEAFEASGLETREAREFYYNRLIDLPDSPADQMSRDYLVAPSLGVEGQRAFISKHLRPQVRETAEGVRPTSQAYWEVEVVSPDGLTLDELTREFDNPVLLGEYLTREGYQPTLYHTYSGTFEHVRDRTMTAVVESRKPVRGLSVTRDEVLEVIGTLGGGTVEGVQRAMTAVGKDAFIRRVESAYAARGGRQALTPAQQAFEVERTANEIVAETRAAPGAVGVEVLERTAPLREKDEVIEAPKLTEAQEAIYAELRQTDREVASAQPLFRPIGPRKYFKTVEEANTWLEGRGFSRRRVEPDLAGEFRRMEPISRLRAIVAGETPVSGTTLVKRKTPVPITEELRAARQKVAERVLTRVKGGKGVKPSERLTEEQGRRVLDAWDADNLVKTDFVREKVSGEAADYLISVEEKLQELMRNYIRTETRIPGAVKRYAQDFSDIFYRTVGRSPFTREYRFWVETPHVGDYGPADMPSLLQTNKRGELPEGIEVTSPLTEDVKAAVTVKIGKSLPEMAQAADQLAKIVSQRPNPALIQTQKGIITELERLAGVLKTSRVMSEVEGAQADLKRMQRTVTAMEKLRLGLRPAPQELSFLPASEEVIRQLAKYDRGIPEALIAGPKSKASTFRTPKDYGIVFPNVLGVSSKSKSDVAQAAKAVSQAFRKQTGWAVAAGKVDRAIPDPAGFSIRTDLNIARYKPTGQLVEIIGEPVEQLVGPEVRVKFIGSQEEMVIAKDDVLFRSKEQAKGPFKPIPSDIETTLPLRSLGSKHSDAQSYALAEQVLDGRYAVFNRKEAPYGYGDIERKLGIFTSNDRLIGKNVFFQRAYELGRQLTSEGGIVTASPDVLDELFDIYRRSQWLDDVVETEPTFKTVVSGKFGTISGKPREKFATQEQAQAAIRRELETGEATPEERIISRTVRGKKIVKADRFSDLVTDALKEVNPRLVKPFRRAAYDRMRQALGDNPFAELQAQAFAGYLTPEAEQTLRAFADEAGLSQGLPLAKIAHELRERQFLDPNTALYAIQVKKVAGIAKWAEEIAGGNAFMSGIPIGGLGGGLSKPAVTIKPVVGPKDLKMGGMFGSSWRIASRHPFSRFIMDLLYRAQENELRSVNKRWREFIVGMEQSGMKFNDRKAIRGLFFEARENGWTTWDQIAANSKTMKGLSPNKRQMYQAGYFRYREFMGERLEDLIRHFFRRKIQPVKFDPTDASDIALANELGIPREQLAEGVMLLPNQPDLVIRNAKYRKVGMTPSKYTEDEINFFVRLRREYGTAAELPPQNPPGIRPEVYEEFKEVFDFWQGYGLENYWPLVHEGSMGAIVGDKIVAWAQTIPDLFDAIRTLRKEGRISASEPVMIRQVGMVADDILIKASPTKRDWQELTRFFADQVDMEPDEVMALMYRSDRPEATMRAPGQVHGKPRKAGLQPVTIDPDKEMALYNARIARAEYRWEVLRAFQAFKDESLDRALSDAYGAPRLHASMPGLQDWMFDMFSRAVGERGMAERVADKFWMVVNWMSEAPRELPAVARGELNIWDVLNPSTYYRKYAARARSSDILRIQSLYRLGFSMGSAFANWTQFFVTTAPKLIQPGETVPHIGKLMIQSQKDGINLWRHWTTNKVPTGELKVLAEMIDASGVDLMPAKQMTGAGMSWGDMTGGTPIRGESLLKLGGDWVQYGAMFFFNGAEKVNRFATAVAAIRRHADRLGKPLEMLNSVEKGEAVDSARRLVRETQFLYDELSIPRAMAAFGPAGRVLFQFKPFMLNMLAYEKDLLHAAFFQQGTRFGKVALGQLGAHFAALSVLGGAVGLAYHPLVSLSYQLFNMISGGDAIHPATKLEAAQRKRRREMATMEENYTQTMNYKADDLLFYGLPAFAGLSMGQRVGVSGQDLMMSFDAPGFFGPHASVYYDFAKALNTYRKSKGREAAVAGGAAGALASTFIPKHIRRHFPFPTLSSITLGGSLASLESTNDFLQYLKTSPEGKQLQSRGLPTAFRLSQKTWELFSHGAIRDMDGKPMNVPVEDRFGEGLSLALGLPSIRREEYTAVLSMLTGQAAASQATRQILTTRAAREWVAGNTEEFYEILYQAAELGVDISQTAIEREMESITQERLSTVLERLPVSDRLKR